MRFSQNVTNAFDSNEIQRKLHRVTKFGYCFACDIYSKSYRDEQNESTSRLSLLHFMSKFHISNLNLTCHC